MIWKYTHRGLWADIVATTRYWWHACTGPCVHCEHWAFAHELSADTPDAGSCLARGCACVGLEFPGDDARIVAGIRRDLGHLEPSRIRELAEDARPHVRARYNKVAAEIERERVP